MMNTGELSGAQKPLFDACNHEAACFLFRKLGGCSILTHSPLTLRSPKIAKILSRISLDSNLDVSLSIWMSVIRRAAFWLENQAI